MICIYAESPLCTLTFIFYTSLCLPLLRTAQSVLRILAFLLSPHQSPENAQSDETPMRELDLPVSRFQRNMGEARSDEEEACAICLTEFGKEDLVNVLPRCGHVFHVECMEKWLDRCHFTCPLCRSLLLKATSSSPCKMWDPASAYCINLGTVDDS